MRAAPILDVLWAAPDAVPAGPEPAPSPMPSALASPLTVPPPSPPPAPAGVAEPVDPDDDAAADADDAVPSVARALQPPGPRPSPRTPSEATGDVRLSVSVVWVATLAEQEALELGHRRLGTEHLLLALVRMGDPVGRCLVERGATLTGVRRAVLRGAPPGPMENANGRPGWSTAASAVVRAARQGARRASRSEVTTLHLATAMFLPGGRSATILGDLGVDPGEVLAVLQPAARPVPAVADATQREPVSGSRADEVA